MDLSYTPSYETDPAQLPAMLRQLVADLADPAISYLLGGHYYDRTNHPRHWHFPAVFALRHCEVKEVEVGADFIAFDAEFVHYPERGERELPAPYTDSFRATVPFSQLYQLCRKVLTPAEQKVEVVEYGWETVIYYNALAHRNLSTPADVSQAYPTAPPSGEHPLVAVLTAVKVGLANPLNHFFVNTTSFDSPDGPVLMGMLHLNTHTAWELCVAADAFTCLVLLTPTQKSTVRVPFAHVWQVIVSDTAQDDWDEVEEAGGMLYDAPVVLSNYARQGKLA